MRDALRLARIVAREYMGRGASAIVFQGSYARGNARRFSDIDLVVVGDRSERVSLVRQGFFVNIRETTVEKETREMRDPHHAGQAVLAWREATLLIDTKRIAARLKERARRFAWVDIGREADRAVGHALAGWAEEAVKLTRLMADGLPDTAGVQRNLLVNAMAGILAVRKRLFYTENDLWDMIGNRMGDHWHETQRRALGVNNPTFDESCEAALELYQLTAHASRKCLSGAERKVVAQTCRAIGYPL